MAVDWTLIETSATDIVALLRNGEISPIDLLDTLEARIAEVNPRVNALPTLCFDRARANARKLMARPEDDRGLLCGLPIPIKDLTDVAGVLTTHGSPIFKDHVPATSDLVVERIEAEGGLVYAKSNTPEFGAGANTFNEVFGPTLNPWNTKLSAAGSSGGAAVALATGMAWIAHGSDMGGSLRNPASFCGVVGMRPTPGRVPSTVTSKLDRNLGVQGPMARNIEDLSLALDAMVGQDDRDPMSLVPPRRTFRAALRGIKRPERVAWSSDLGITPVDPEVADIAKRAAFELAHTGCVVEEAHPDFSEAHECFGVLRAYSFAVSYGGLLKTHRDKLKPEIVWNIEKGLALTVEQLAKAEAQRAAMFHRMHAFMERYDALLTPATIVAAFPVEERYVKSVGGVEFPDYVQWLSIAYAATLVCSPAMSMPCGFTADGRPVGLQLIGRNKGEHDLLTIGKILEDMLDLTGTIPMTPR